jgi:hypothetical protein
VLSCAFEWIDACSNCDCSNKIQIKFEHIRNEYANKQ